MIKTMKAAILAESKKPLIIDQVELPEGLEYGQVLIKIKNAGLCGSQLNEIDAVKMPDKYLPHLTGHEGVGFVDQIGPGVKKVVSGDTVVLHWRKGTGIDAPTAKYKWQGRNLNSGQITTFSEYSIVSENRLTKVSGDANLETAVLYGCATTTGFGTLNKVSNVGIGDSIIVTGIGPVGINVVLAAKLKNAYPIIAVDIDDEKLNLAKFYGADAIINSKKTDIKSEISKILPMGADFVIECSGIKEVIETAYSFTSDNGQTIMVGVPNGNINLYPLPLFFNKKLKGSHGGDTNPSEDIPKIMQLETIGRIDLNPMITHKFNLDQINDAIDLMRASKCMKCLIKM